MLLLCFCSTMSLTDWGGEEEREERWKGGREEGGRRKSEEGGRVKEGRMQEGRKNSLGKYRWERGKQERKQ